ncbi:hypothetical protein AMECASPLE_018736 [Ameca splendens]|uniref:Uncharacterized protein n=1 Tax=Ameca splendens TaxID=208324 RepID=A0ABV0XS36_9TELE
MHCAADITFPSTIKQAAVSSIPPFLHTSIPHFGERSSQFVGVVCSALPFCGEGQKPYFFHPASLCLCVRENLHAFAVPEDRWQNWWSGSVPLIVRG